jgi:hypothetical protein
MGLAPILNSGFAREHENSPSSAQIPSILFIYLLFIYLDTNTTSIGPKILALTANLGHISRVQKPGLRPTALAFLYPRPGQKPAQAKGWAWLGPAFFGLAWPGFWPQAGAGTSLILPLRLVHLNRATHHTS